MNNELLAMLDYIEQERGISKDQLVAAVESAIASASRKSIHPASKLEVKLDRKTGQIRAWAKLTVVDSFPNNDQITIEKARTVFPDVKPGDEIQLFTRKYRIVSLGGTPNAPEVRVSDVAAKTEVTITANGKKE